MLPITLSYSVGISTNKQVGAPATGYSTGSNSILEQLQANVISNAQELNYPFYLPYGGTQTIDLVSQGFVFVKLIVIKSTFTDLTSTPLVRLTYTNGSNVSTIESSFIFINREIPTVIPTRPIPDTHNLIIENLSATNTEGTLYLIGLKNN